MIEPVRGAVWVVLASTGWLIPRHIAKARLTSPAAVMIDVLPVLIVAGLLLIATGRPIFAGFVVLSLGAGFASCRLEQA